MRKLFLAVLLLASPVAALPPANVTMANNQPRPVTPSSVVGPDNLFSGQVGVGTTAVLVVAARLRQSVDVTTDGAVKCYLGPAGVTAATGFPLQAVAGASKTVPSSAAVYAVCASTVTLGYMEHF